MKISLCTTCCNRLYQFEKTIDDNYEIVKENPSAEWIIVNYNSKDNLHEYMMSRLPNISCRVSYVVEKSGRTWHASCAKNVAHSFATGDILLNLDCDNFLGNSLETIQKKFSEGIEVMQLWTGIPYDGTYGRIAITKKIFDKINGYDESLYPMGGQDSDLMHRAIGIGAKSYIHVSSEYKAIKNSKEDSLKNAIPYGMDWHKMAMRNKKTINANLKAQKFVANMPNGRAKMEVEIFRGVVA